MNLSKVTMFKKFFCLIILSIFITSCEPEALPSDNQNDPVKIFADGTGDQKTTVETKP